MPEISRFYGLIIKMYFRVASIIRHIFMLFMVIQLEFLILRL